MLCFRRINMGECNKNSSYGTTKAEYQHKSHGCCDKMTDSIKKLANEAWAELLKDKIKKQFEIKVGERMDKIAEIAADASIECWKHKIEAKEVYKDYENKLVDAIRSYK